MYISSNIISKSYPDFNESKLKIHLRTDDDLFVSGSTELIDLYRDSVSYIEKKCQKDIAKTIKQYDLYQFIGSEFIIDETNVIAVSAITYISDGNLVHISDYQVVKDLNKIKIILPFSVSISDYSALTIILITGYEANQMPGNIRRAILQTASDFYYSERGSYTVTSNRSDIVDRLLAGEIKVWHNYVN